MRIIDYVRRILEVPPRQIARTAADVVWIRWARWQHRLALSLGRDAMDEKAFARLPGVARETRNSVASDLFRSDGSVLPVRWSDAAAGFHLPSIRSGAKEAMAHRFDLLGSGRVRPSYDLKPAGVAGHVYRAAHDAGAADRHRGRMNALLQEATVGAYEPIDWHTDFKSGYRWSADHWSTAIRIGHLPGVDVKVPWELSRFQHSGVLGLVWRCDPLGREGKCAPAEFQAQVVDWIAANPVGRGVNWACSMDVALRAVGWLVGIALMNNAPELTRSFRSLVARSLYAHGRHIEANLEYQRTQTGNHYLSNVVGLLCIGAALPELRGSDRWCVFGIQELVSEMERQVLPDGGDIEGSVPYHHLVAELFLLGTLVALRLPEKRRLQLRDVAPGRVRSPVAPHILPLHIQRFDLARPEIFPGWYLHRLLGMGELASTVTKPDGRIPQIGDNDNGRAFRLSPAMGDCQTAGADDPCNRRIVAAVAGRLFGRPALTTVGSDFKADAALVVADAPVAAVREAIVRFQTRNEYVSPQTSICGIRDDAGPTIFPDTGLAIVKHGPLYLAVSFGNVSRISSGGHFHNDLLSFELQWDGIDFIIDGGTFLYTAMPEMRDAFRSADAHNTLVVRGRPQRTWPAGPGRLFAARDHAAVRVLDATAGRLAIEILYGDVRHVRRWYWTENSVRVEDVVTAPHDSALLLNVHPAAHVSTPRRTSDSRHRVFMTRAGRRLDLELEGASRVETLEGLYSPGYGVRVRNTQLRAQLPGSAATARMEFTHTAEAALSLRAAQSEEANR